MLKNFTTVILAVLTMRVLCASDDAFDEKFSVKITSCSGNVRPPSIYSNYWKANTFIYFDNGLYGVTDPTYWKYESQAQQMANFNYSGNCNILPYFSILREGREYRTRINLWLDKSHPFTGLPLVRSIKKEAETISHWFFAEEHQYRYTVELNDDTVWMTKIRKSPWENIWKEGSRILKIGNSQHPCLINIDAVTEDLSTIESKHYLADVERVK
jgi:hypothetical protein